MQLPETVDSALRVAHEIALRTAETLSAGPRRLYTVLVATGLKVAQEKQYSSKVTEVTFFAPAESVALSVGCHVSSLYRWLPTLTALNLVAAKGHFCTHNGQTKQDGTVWTVKFRQSDKRVRVGFDWLKKSYRCLGADIDAGRTAWQQIRESKPTTQKATINLNYLRRWTLSVPSKNPISNDSRFSKQVDLESIFDVPAVSKQNRAETIYNAAKTISSTLQDGNKSTRFFMAVLWNLARIRDRTGADYFGQLHTMICRVRADVEEDFARSGFALLHSRLKQADLLPDLLRSS
jgi:hypothetical protein